ncbi:MAG TPA: L,D-transpeptidase, partial [Gaiellaceae bacterium]|nr:L,D-transpeptidase [Gaiellaceae bacterium]
ARVVLPSFAGRATAAQARTASGATVPLRLRGGALWPSRKLAAGAPVTVTLTVRRPGWAAWLVGRVERRTFTVRTPAAHLLGRWLQVRKGAPVTIAFDAPVGLVSLDGKRTRQLATPRRSVRVPGAARAGSVEIAAAARSWERLPAPVRVSWFPAQRSPQLLAEPAPGKRIGSGDRLTLTFSDTVQDVLGSRRPRLEPATAGRWHLLDAHTLAFRPTGIGYGLGATVRVRLPRAVHLAGAPTAKPTRTLAWHVPAGSTLRLEQLLAEAGYLPLDWRPTGDPPSTLREELDAAVSPPPGRFSWRYPHTPPELKALWQPGSPNEIVRGAVMMFEHDHDLAVDGLAGPRVWRELLDDELAGKRKPGGYSYVFVHRNVPQSLNLWHDGKVIVTSPGNTGVPAAPTALGTFPVFEHIPVGRMSGTNPDGSHYDDPGIQWISYFHGGEAIHAFNRGSYGTPQSLGCVELPLSAAAAVWPYTPIGTLVTIED